MDARGILPPECWELVFDKVEDPQDWLNLYRTSWHLQEVVGGKRTTALFPQVFPHVFDYLGEQTLADILGLRLVCRPWKTVVDNLLENSDSDRVEIRRELERMYYLENSPALISSFLKRFEVHSGGNPFVGRYAYFLYDYSLGSAAIAEYSLFVTSVLSKFGAQLKTLIFEILHTHFDNCLTLLQSCLQFVPNLDSLRVTCVFSQDPRYRHRYRGDALVIPNVEEGSLPLVRNLKSLFFIGLPGWAQLLDMQNALALLSCNPNSLKSVNIQGFPTKLLKYPNVESAKVSLAVLEDCSKLASTSWPLSKLSLCDDTPPKVPLSLVFECIEHFKATLTTLRLTRPILRDPLFIKSTTTLLDLPHLKQLTIQEHPSMSLEFLTKLSSLEVLYIHIHRNYPNRLNARSDLQRFVKCVRTEVVRWGLWEGLPKLTKIWLIGPSITVAERRHAEMRHVATRSSRRKFQRKQNQRERGYRE